jgi:hypothetical protein
MKPSIPEETAMKTAFALAAALSLAAGCATQDVQVAQAPAPAPTCKVAPITTASATEASTKKPVSEIRQREAQMDLALTQYRFRNLQRQGLFMNNVEGAIGDCDATLGKQ